MTALDLLVAQFPGKTFIPMTDAGQAIGYERQTCYNLHHAKQFPLPVRKVGAKCMVALTDLASFMNGGQIVMPSNPIEELAKRRPGRPTKAEQIAARRLS